MLLFYHLYYNKASYFYIPVFEMCVHIGIIQSHVATYFSPEILKHFLNFNFHSHYYTEDITRAWCKTIVTSYIKSGSYNSFAPSPRLY